jgi:hypothetical protein
VIEQNKVILVDLSYFMFRGIHCYRTHPEMKSTFTALSMLIASLKRLPLTPDDIIILACDKGRSWRKTIDSNYKSNRKSQREALEDKIWWDARFKEFEILRYILEEATPFHIIEIDTIEADDIIAYAVRYYKDKQCYIVSPDSDFEQLAMFPNVKIFSPISKKYKIIKNPQEVLAKKMEIERVDNLITPIVTEEDFHKRKLIVDLTTLPDFVEKLIDIRLSTLNYLKKFDLEKLPYTVIQNRFMGIYNSDKVIDENKPTRKPKKKGGKK